MARKLRTEILQYWSAKWNAVANTLDPERWYIGGYFSALKGYARSPGNSVNTEQSRALWYMGYDDAMGDQF